MSLDAFEGGEDVNDIAKLGPWEVGVNNRLPDYALGPKDLRDAANVDIRTSGHVRRRTGVTQQLSGVAHSLWSDDEGELSYVVFEGQLRRVLPGGSLGAAIALDMGLSPVSYFRLGETVYWCNGVRNGRIIHDQYFSWGMEPPSHQPRALANPQGNMDPGDYQFAQTWLNARGEESGTGASGIVVGVPAGGGFTLEGFATPPPGATQMRIYQSLPYGKVLYVYETVPIGTPLVSVVLNRNLGTELKTQFLRPPPVGHLVEYFNGRLYLAAGAVLYFSEPLGYLLFNPRMNFQLFNEDITILAAATAGLAVVADQHYFLEGNDATKFQQRQKLPFRGIVGSMSRMPQSRSRIGQGNVQKLAQSRDAGVVWRCDRGLVIMDMGGDMRVVTEDQLIMRAGRRGASLVRETDGLRHIITSVSDASEDNDTMMAKDFLAGKALER